MGITFRHDAAAGMIGAYAAGEASGRRRRQKYALDMLQQQRHRMRATGGTRRALTGTQMEGQWADPLAQPGLTGQDAVFQRAQQNARARKYRMGKDIPAAWRPTFTSQEELEQDRDDFEWKRKVAQEAAIDKRELEQSQEAAAAAREHAENMQIDRGLQSGDLVLSPRATDAIQKAKDEYADAVTSGKWTDEQLDDIRQQAEDKIRKAKRVGASPPDQPSDIDRAGQTAGYFNDAGKFVQGARPGGRPEYQAIDGKYIPIPPPAETAEQAAQKAQQEKQEAAAEKYQTRVDKIVDQKIAMQSSQRYADADETEKARIDALYDNRIKALPQPSAAETSAPGDGGASAGQAGARRVFSPDGKLVPKAAAQPAAQGAQPRTQQDAEAEYAARAEAARRAARAGPQQEFASEQERGERVAQQQQENVAAVNRQFENVQQNAPQVEPQAERKRSGLASQAERQANVTARAKAEGDARRRRMGVPAGRAGRRKTGAGTVQARAIAAARAGDPNAQRALDERNIPWRQL